jgi:hypothetical protein
MLPLTRMTPEQIENYRPAWGKFTGMSYIFGAPHRTFAFYVTLHVSEEGQIALQDILVACSCEHKSHELVQEIQKLQENIADDEWQIVSRDAHHMEGVREEFQLTFLSETTRDGTVATHLLLSYGEADRHRDAHLHQHFLLRSDYAKQPSTAKAQFYPVGTNYAPEKAESLDVQELARRLWGKPIVAFTGAGISLSSGIPSFRGQGGLAEHFPLHEAFPGEVTDWMINRPRELAQVLGHFQACFITAQPNAAHFALAELEKQGTLKHLITGNDDLLHERAGSRQVHLKHSHYFVDSQEGWNWIRAGEIFLVVGVSKDEHGFLGYARDQGIPVVVIAPERPSFLCAEDWFVQGRGEDILPELAAERMGRRKFMD